MAREFRGKIPRVPIDADTSQADKKIDRLYEKVKGLKNIEIDADVNQAQRRLETIVKRTNSQMTSNLVNMMLKDVKTVLGAMKTEFEKVGTTDIYRSLEKTCDMVEDRFSNLNISIDKKQISGLTEILNTVDEMQSISNFSFGEIVSSQAVKNSEKVLSNIRATKKEITSIAGKADYIIKALNKSTDKAFSTEKLQDYKNKLHELRGSLKGFYSIDDELIQNSLLNAAAKINEALGQIDIQLPKSKSTADILSVGETVKGLDKVKREVKEAADAYESLNDIITKSRDAILGSDFGNKLFNRNSVEGYADSLTKVRDKMAEIREEAYAAKVNYEATITAIDTYTGRNLGNKTAFQNAIKDSWKSGEHQAAAKLFEQYQIRFTDGKFNPAKQFGTDWSNNFAKNLEEANRSLSIWRAQLKNAAAEYGKWMAFDHLQEQERLLQGGYEKALRDRAAAEKEAAKSAQMLEQAQKDFATDDLTVAQNNLNKAIDEYNAKLAESNRLLTEKHRLEGLDSYENEPWYQETELPANHIVAIAQQFAEAEDAANLYKIALKEAVRVYRELGGDMKLPFSDEGLLKEIDIPVKVVVDKSATDNILPQVVSYDEEELEIIQKENGALAEKLELLQDIAEQYANNITLRDRNRFEELNQKDMDGGLTPRQEERYWELGEAIDEADRQIAEFGEIYSRVILKLANGKKIEILPDDAGLKKFDKIANEYYSGEYNGIEIEDVLFERIQATTDAILEQKDVIEQLVEEQKKLNEPKDIMSYDDAKKWSSFAEYEHLRKQEDQGYLKEHGSEVLEGLEHRSQTLASMLKPVDEIVSRISKNASIKTIPADNLKQEAASVAQALSTMYEDGIRDTEEYITLQYKLMNLFDTIGKQYGGVKGSGAKDATQLRHWIMNSINDETGYDISSSNALDALWGQEQFSIFETNSQLKTMLELAGELTNYKGLNFDGGFGAKYDKAEYKRLQPTIKTIKEIVGETNVLNTKMAETAKLIGELQTKYGTDRFTEIFGDIGTLDASNAEAVYDLLIAKEKEYGQELINRANIIAEFTTQNSGLIGQFANTDKFNDVEVKVGELSAGIYEGTLSLEEANKQLQEFVGTLNKTEKTIEVNDNIISSNKELSESFNETADAIKQQDEAISEYYKSSLPDNTIKQLTKGVDINGLFKDFNIPVNDRPAIQAEFDQLIDVLYDLIVNENDTVDMYDLQKNKQLAIEEMIVKLGSVKQDRTKLYEEFYNYMQNMQIGYTDADKAEFGDDWTNIIRKFGAGLLELFPALFDSNIINEKDQLKKILDVVQRARDEHKNKSKSESAELTADAINYVHGIINDSVATISTNALSISDEIQKAVEQERLLREAALDAGNAIEGQAGAAKNTAEATKSINAGNDIGDKSDTDKKIKIINKTVEDALAQLRNAKNNKNLMIDLSEVASPGDLETQVGNLVTKALNSDLTVGSIAIHDNIAQIGLYNKELGVTTQQMWKLEKATEGATKAQLSFVKADPLRVNLEQAEKYAQAQQKIIDDSEKWLINAQKRLDAQKRDYQNSQKKISGSSALNNVDATTLENDANKTIDGLAAHIQNRIESSMGKSISNSIKNSITKDLNALENEIKIKQLEQYTSTTMSASEAEAARKVILDTIDTIATNAQKKNVFDQIRESYETLRGRLTDSTREDYISTNFTEAINEMRVLRADASKASAEEGNLKNLLALQEQLYNAKKKVAELEIKGQKDSADGMAASRKAAELEAQYNASVKLLENEQQREQVANRQIQLERELNQFKTEQTNKQQNKQQQETEVNQANSIKSQYQTILDLVNKINTANERMIKFQSMDGGSGLLGKQIAEEQQKKFEAVEKLNAAMAEINVGDVLGKDQYTLPEDVKSIGTDYSQIAAFINDAGVQASLTTAEIEKLVNAFVKAGDIDLSMLSEVLGNESVKARAKQVAYESKYFSDKQTYSADLKVEDIQKLGTASTTTKEKLEGMAQAIAQNSEGAVALTKNFSQGADGIARLDFSILDTNTGSIRDFTIELGTATNQVAVFDTTVDKSVKNVQKARSQMAAAKDVLGRLGYSDAGVEDTNTPKQVTDLLAKIKLLRTEIAKDDGADQNAITKYTKDVRDAQKELEKLENNMRKMENAIASGQATSYGKIDPSGDVYGQLTRKAQEFASIQNGATLELGAFDKVTNTLNASLIHANGTVEQFKFSMYGVGGEVAYQQAGVTKLATSWDRFKTSIGQAGKQLMTAFAGANVFYKAISEVRKGVGYVKEIDLALTELKKVTDETEASYRKFLNTAAGSAGEIGSTLSDYTEATANFARLGYTMEESANMAKTAIVYKNVADGLDSVEESTDSIISTMKAFGIESDDTMGIIDRFNEVGNNFAITSAGIGEALQRSASALYAGGNTIDESIALVTAANSVIQNPEQVGTALKTLTLRLRGAKVELEEAGLETENMAESTSTLQAKLKALTHGKVDIMIDADTFKNTTQILREMSQVWGEMTDIEQASALELMGGKRQANILSSLISNFETVEEVIETSMNSSGSAIAENEKYLDSIQGRIDQFTNSMQTFWNNMLDSDVIKGFVEFGTKLIKFLDSWPGKITAIAVALGALAKFKGVDILGLPVDISNRVHEYSRVVTELTSLTNQYKTVDKQFGPFKTYKINLDTQGITAYANAVKGLTATEQAERLVKQGLNKEQIKEIMTRAGVENKVIQETLSKKNLLSTTTALRTKTVEQVLTTDMAADAQQKDAINTYLAAHAHDKLTKELVEEMHARKLISDEQYTQWMQDFNVSWKSTIKDIAKSPAVIMMAATAIAGLINQITTAKEKTEELKEEYSELQSSMSEIEGELDSLDSELETIQDRIDELNKKDSLSLTDAKELNLLKQQSAELQHQKEIQEKLLAAREQQEDAKSLTMINNMLKTTAAGQQKAAEDTANAWKIAGGVIVAAAAAIAGFYTGGATWAAIPTALGWAAGGAVVGSAIGEKAGYAIGMSSNEAGDSLIEWYESYEEAIAEAEQEASEAEAEYMSKMTEKNHKKWQEKLEYINTLQTEMYNGLTELQGYVSNLEYDESTSAIIDGYNNLMAHIDVSSMGGNIDAQINSIESLKDEYYELSKGVDEHGNNIALTAEEYARYNSIIGQVLQYQSGLTKGFDENGNAILQTANAQYTYNELLKESIELLKQQKIEAAKQEVNDENIIASYKAVKETNFDSTFKNMSWYQDRPDALSVNTWKNPHGVFGGANWGTDDVTEVISKVIGIDFSLSWGDVDKYLTENIESIQQHRDEITARLWQEMNKMGLSYDQTKAYIDQTNKWIDNIGGQFAEVQRSVAEAFKKKLYVVPQSSDFYYDLDGTSLAFINEYISAYTDSIDNIEKLSDDEVKAIRDNIKNLTDVIGQSEVAQDIIGDIFELDTNDMPISAYTKSFNDLLNKLVSELQLTDEQKNTISSALFPDQDQINTMIEDVGAKLKVGSQGLVKNLTLEELRIAYKIIPELPDDITFEELREEIQKRLPQATGPIVQTYSTLIDQVEQFNEVVAQTSEIVLDNTKVTQEYKDSLVALGISEEELAECFDATNSLVVTNAKKLNDLVKSANKNTSQNVKLAKSQATLQYYELYKEMQGYISAEGKITEGTKDQIIALYQEMNALEKTIARYSMLETQLLGAANAYEKFEQAQEIDSETDYMSSAEDMVLALGEAFNTGKLGTESAQAAIMGLVPESVYKDLDTVDEKMAAIYDYFKNGKISQYFDLEFDDDGAITGAEMKLGNLRKFIEDGLNDNGANVFDGSDWQHFEFSDEFLGELDNLPDKADKLQYFADKTGVTKEVAFAFIKSLEDHDIEWLNGDYSTMFDELIPETFETKIYSAAQDLADLNAQLANGEITAEEYAKQYGKLSAQYEDAKTNSRNNMFGEDGLTGGAEGYLQVNQDVIEAQNNVTEATEALTEANAELTEARAEGKTGDDLKPYEDAVEEATQTLLDHEKGLKAALELREKFEEPTEAEIKIVMDDIEAEIKAAGGKFDQALTENFDLDENGYYTLKAGVDISQLEEKYPGIQHHVALLNSRTQLTAYANTGPAEITMDTLSGQIDEIIGLLDSIKINLDPESVTEFSRQLGELCKPQNIPVYLGAFWEGITGGGNVNGTANIRGTAHASGNWGLPTSEHDSLVGELGPEIVVNPYTGRYYTVGDNGAEFVDLPRGAIIFNHKQTEGLLKNGHIASRGKAYAEGNAHLTIFAQGSSKNQWEGTGYDGPDDSTYDLSEALDNVVDSVESASDAADEFAEIFDWIEVRLEEINEQLDLMNAQLENAGNYASKNNIIDSIIGVNKTKMANLTAGIQKYSDYAAKLLADVPAQYRAAAQDGAIAITEFVGEADEKTVEAINNYRDWAQKVADLKQELEGVKTEIRDLAIQKIENAYNSGSVRADVEASQTEKLQNRVDFDEEKGLITASAYYTAMMENSSKTIEYLTAARNEMQKAFNEAVTSGQLEKGSDEWYEQLNELYGIDAEIYEATIELEEFQNAINDIYWDNFDELINRLDYLKEETQSLIDLMDSDDMVVTPETDDGWSADQVEWTKEGIASMGLYAQQMEIAEYQSKQYAKAIDDLTADYQKGLYSENEYLEKLNELKEAQYENIEAYYDAQDAIVELNEARIDAIKEGIEKEIEAYEELINKKKEELDAEKDLYDFQKSTMEQQKNIADIQRKLAALSGDNSASAVAKRKQLEAELAEANADLEESYYDRSVENKQNALDKELEDFQNEKDAEIEKWEEYLTNVETVVAESLGVVQANATSVYDTLNAKAQEYDLTLSDAIMTPWQDGVLAVSDYQTTFDTAISSTMDQLEALKNKWQEVIDKMAEAGNANVADINKENANYASATYTPPVTTSKPVTTKPAETSKPSLTKGSYVEVKPGTKWYADSSGGGAWGYAKSGTIKYVNTKGSHAYNIDGLGWIKKTDIKGYAKGSKGIKEDQWAFLDELGEELQFIPGQNGRLEFVKKGTGIVPADLTERIMDLAMNPQEVLDRNRPSIVPSKSVVNNNMEIHVDASVGTLLHVDHLDGNNPEEVVKIVDKAWDKKMQNLNSAIKKFVR